MTSCHHRSRSSFQDTSIPVRRTTTTCSMGLSGSETASSAASLRGAGLPRRNCPSLVISSLASASAMRACSALAVKPANTTLCMMPRRAQASIAITASGISGR